MILLFFFFFFFLISIDLMFDTPTDVVSEFFYVAQCIISDHRLLAFSFSSILSLHSFLFFQVPTNFILYFLSPSSPLSLSLYIMSFPYLTMAMCMFSCFCLFLSVFRSISACHSCCCILWWIFDLSIGIPRRMARTYVYVCMYVYMYVCVCVCIVSLCLTRRRERSDALWYISLHLSGFLYFLHMACNEIDLFDYVHYLYSNIVSIGMVLCTVSPTYSYQPGLLDMNLLDSLYRLEKGNQ